MKTLCDHELGSNAQLIDLKGRTPSFLRTMVNKVTYYQDFSYNCLKFIDLEGIER